MVKEKKEFLWLVGLIGLGVVLVDQILKYAFLQNETFYEGSIFSLHLIKNTGAGFGILANNSLVLGVVSLVVAMILIVLYPKIEKETFVQVCFALFFAGTVGNMIDRFARQFVVDFIDFSFWPAFNVADMAITLAAIGFIWYYWKKRDPAH